MSDNPTYGPPRPGQPGGAGAYLQRQLEQASPIQTLLLLLDGALKFTMQAKEAIGRRDIAGRHAANARAMEIVSFLITQQDSALGAEAAGALGGILAKVLQRQTRIDFDNSAEVCDEVAGHLRQLRAGFASLQPVQAKVVAGPEASPTSLKVAASA
jgi:flagellar secretion chaperone FliS